MARLRDRVFEKCIVNGVPPSEGPFTLGGIPASEQVGHQRFGDVFDHGEDVYYTAYSKANVENPAYYYVTSESGIGTYYNGFKTDVYTLDVTNDVEYMASTTNKRAFNLIFKPDGTKFYFIAYDGAIQSYWNRRYLHIFEYEMTTPWMISTATLNGSTSLGSWSSIGFIYISPDGYNLWFRGGNDSVIRKYYMNTAWDISTLNTNATWNSSNTFNFGFSSGFGEVFFDENGSNMFLWKATGTFRKYPLAVPYDPTTASTSNYETVPFPSGLHKGINFGKDGKKLYLDDNNTYRTIVLTLNTPYDPGSYQKQEHNSSDWGIEVWKGSILNDTGTFTVKADTFASNVYPHPQDTYLYALDYATSSSLSTSYPAVHIRQLGHSADLSYIVRDKNKVDTEIGGYFPTNNTNLGYLIDFRDPSVDNHYYVASIPSAKHIVTHTKLKALSIGLGG